MIFNGTETIYNIKLQTCRMLGLEYRPLINTTLNEKLNIYPNFEIENPDIPKLNLITLGIGGSDIINNDVLNLKRSKHGGLDGALLEMLPLMIKPYGTTLDEYESNNYRLKALEVINDIAYDVYYGLILEDIDYDPRIYKINSNELSLDSVIVKTSTNQEILNPVMKSGLLNNDSDYEYLINTCKVGINLNTTLMGNINNAIAIKYVNRPITTITEIGLCSSIDMLIDGRNESIWTQVNYFIDLNLETQLLNSKIEQTGRVYLNVDIGGMKPLII